MKFKVGHFLGFLSVLLIGTQGFPAPRDLEIEAELKQFHENSKAYLAKLPPKYNSAGNRILRPGTHFSSQVISSKDFVTIKDNLRLRKFKNLSQRGRSDIENGDKPEQVVDQLIYTNLEDLEKQSLTKATLPETPWSDDYWPISSGNIAKRYADRSFMKVVGNGNWKATFDFFTNNPTTSSVDALSPAEKYDLIVGDEKKTLTNAMWREGKTYWDATKSVETWMGICHGWAPASFMMGRPKHSVNVLAADGKTKVTFFPSDIKALESLLWANGSFKQKLMGTRCTSKKPRSDSNGRMIGQDCFDNNPGSFHLAITNQIGIAGKKTNGFEKRGLVLDATFDYEVWNHPIYGYKYSYTNAQTGKSVGSISAAAVTPTEFTKDKFKKYRSPKAVKIVGIAMDVTYMIETQPSTSDSNSPDDDLETTVRYLYDLEIDNSGEIIGGEWYSNAHPDFLWTASEGTQAKSFVDSSLSGTWEDKDSVPKQWQSLAPKASFYSQPIAKIIQEIVERAQ